MTYLSTFIIVILTLMISSSFSVGTIWANTAVAQGVQLHPPDRGWAPLLEGAIRDAAHGYYYHPKRGLFFDISTDVSANLTLGIHFLPDRWFRYTYTLTNRSPFPIRTIRLPVPSQTRRPSPRLVHEQTEMVWQFSEADGQADQVLTLYWGDQQGELPVTRYGLLPGKSVSFSFESPDPPRPAHLWLRSDGWQFSVSTNWLVNPPKNDWVMIPVLGPVAIPQNQGVYLDSFVKDLSRSPLLKPDITLPASVSVNQMARALIDSYGTPDHAAVVAKWQQRVADLPSPSVFKDAVYAGLMYYDGLIPILEDPETPSANQPTDTNKKGVQP